MTRITMTMHQDQDHVFWADSTDVPGYTALERNPVLLMDLVNDANRKGFLGEDVDLRWSYCGHPNAGVIAISGFQDWLRVDRAAPCGCSE